MVLTAIVRTARLRSLTNFFLANLAIADFSVGVFCVLPTLSTFLSQTWILGRIMCKVYYFMWNLSYTVSILILTAIAIERYIAIRFPLKARGCFTSRRLILTQVVIWVIAATYSTPYLLILDTFSTKDIDGQVLEYCFYRNKLINMKIYTTANFIAWYTIPLLIMMIIYYCIGKILWRTSSVYRFTSSKTVSKQPDEYGFTSSSQSSGMGSQLLKMRSLQNADCDLVQNEPMSIKSGRGFSIKRRDNCQPESAQYNPRNHFLRVTSFISRSESTNTAKIVTPDPSRLRTIKAVRSRRKVIRLLVAVVVLFALCVLPHHIRLLLKWWGIRSVLNAGIFSPISFLILYSNSAFNPILYALFSANFRKSFKEFSPLRFLRRRKRSLLFQETKLFGIN
ncbi:trissin receptor-like [Saccostrea echinata]|uniref:trissin receptor-like n=1 Tax=Saccostrea echinata TaxID=191078 RepID=UPI002A8037D3|nr:trissin receptor-like [Saccostrea echinata]